MQINNNSQNFKAIKAAQIQSRIARNPATIDLYKLTKKDTPFLHKLKEKTSYKELCPNLIEPLQARWQQIFNYCIECALEKANTTYIALCKNKPCGIITFVQDTKLFLEGICAIPNSSGERVPFIGQTMFYQLFKDAKASKAEEIVLEAVTDGPFDVINKYKELGFVEDIATFPYRTMYCSKYMIQESLMEMKSEFEYIKTEPENVNLNEFLD